MAKPAIAKSSAPSSRHGDDLAAPGRKLAALMVRRVRLPLVAPYKLSYNTFTEFEPFVVEATDGEGAVGWGEGHISPGSSRETREGGWAFVEDVVPALPGLPVAEARARVLTRAQDSPVAASALVTALEMLGGHRVLAASRAVDHDLLVPIAATEPAAIEQEVASLLAAGYRTFKVKVGKDAAADIARVGIIQRAAAGQASLRIDANRAYSRADAIRFATGIRPDGVELFEQPCATEAWDDNAAVAAVSKVPLMLDEPICSVADVERAGRIPGVRFCKIKLKRFSGLSRLIEALDAIRANGMGAVLGDGLGADLSGWMEAMCGAGRIHGTGEFNGYEKLKEGILTEPLPGRRGHIHIPAGFVPVVDRARIARMSVASRKFAAG